MRGSATYIRGAARGADGGAARGRGPAAGLRPAGLAARAPHPRRRLPALREGQRGPLSLGALERASVTVARTGRQEIVAV